MQNCVIWDFQILDLGFFKKLGFFGSLVVIRGNHIELKCFFPYFNFIFWRVWSFDIAIGFLTPYSHKPDYVELWELLVWIKWNLGLEFGFFVIFITSFLKAHLWILTLVGFQGWNFKRLGKERERVEIKEEEQRKRRENWL